MRQFLLALLVCSVVITSASAQSFPGSVYTPLIAADNVQTSLSTGMTSGDTVAIVKSSTGWVPNMVAYICDAFTGNLCTGTFEAMLVTSVSTNVLTVTRGYGGTSAVAHVAGKSVSNATAAVYNTTLSNEVHAIEAALGANLTNVASFPASSQRQTLRRKPNVTGTVYEFADPTLVNALDYN